MPTLLEDFKRELNHQDANAKKSNHRVRPTVFYGGEELSIIQYDDMAGGTWRLVCTNSDWSQESLILCQPGALPIKLVWEPIEAPTIPDEKVLGFRLDKY